MESALGKLPRNTTLVGFYSNHTIPWAAVRGVCQLDHTKSPFFFFFFTIFLDATELFHK